MQKYEQEVIAYDVGMFVLGIVEEMNCSELLTNKCAQMLEQIRAIIRSDDPDPDAKLASIAALFERYQIPPTHST